MHRVGSMLINYHCFDFESCLLSLLKADYFDKDLKLNICKWRISYLLILSLNYIQLLWDCLLFNNQYYINISNIYANSCTPKYDKYILFILFLNFILYILYLINVKVKEKETYKIILITNKFHLRTSCLFIY